MEQAPERPEPHEPSSSETPDSPRFIAVCLTFTAAAAIHGIARLALRLVPGRPAPEDRTSKHEG